MAGGEGIGAGVPPDWSGALLSNFIAQIKAYSAIAFEKSTLIALSN